MGEQKKPVLAVLAAGMGSRYGGLKQMDPMGGYGQGLIDYSVYDARRAGFETVVFIIKREIEEDFRRLVGERISAGVEVKYAYQEMDDLPGGYAVPAGRIKPWGTVHAVLALRGVVDGPFAVINADDYYGPEAYRLIYDFLTTYDDTPEEYRYAMAGYLLGNTVTEHGGVTRGICSVGADGCLSGIRERTGLEKTAAGARYSDDGGVSWTELPGDTPVSMNFWGFRPSLLREAEERMPAYLDRILREDPLKKECYLPMLVEDLLVQRRAQVRVLPSGDRWFGVTYREDKAGVVAALEEKTRQGIYPENLWGV